MFRIPPAPAAREPTAVNHHPLGGAAAVGALLGVGVLALTLADVPVLAWMLLGAVATTALVDIARTAAGWESPSLLEPLAQRRLGGAWPAAVRRPGRLSIGVIEEVEGGLDGGEPGPASSRTTHTSTRPGTRGGVAALQWQVPWPRSVKLLPGSDTNRQS